MSKKTLPDLTKWFGFKSKEYTVDAKNPEIMAFNKDFANEIIRRSEQAIISETAPKFVLLELSGDGKTHAMNYALNQLESRDLIEKVYFVCPSMTSGARYSVLHAAIISHMDEKKLILPTVKKIFQETSADEPDDWIDKIKEKIGYESIAKAIYNVCSENALESQFLEYIMGHKIDKATRIKLGVLDSLNVEESIRVLRVISKLYYESNNKMLVIVIDEADELKSVKQHVREFKEAFRRMAEIPHLGLVIIYNIATQNDMKFDTLPTGLKDPGVVSRIGSENYMFKPRPMHPDHVKPLILEINKTMKGENFKQAFMKAKKGNPNLSELAYPFSPDAIDVMVSKVRDFFSKEKGVYILPRDVIRFAKGCITDAALDNKLFVDKKVVEKREYYQSYSKL